MSRFGKPDKTTEHHYFEDRLSAYLDGELVPQERDAVEHHLSTCPACRWDLDTLRKTVQWTRELPTVPVPRVFTIQVPATPQREVRRSWRFVPALQAATAVIALLLFFTVTGDFMLGGFRMAGAPEQAFMVQQQPVVVEATRVVELPREAPPAATEAAAAIVVETVVVEVEVEQPVEAPAEKLAVQPAPAPLPTSATAPASPEEAEIAADEGVPSAPGIGGVEGESQPAELGLGCGPSPTLEMELPTAAGGEPATTALTSAAQTTALPTGLVAAQPEELATAEPTAPAGGPEELEPVSLGLRLIEFGLGALLVLLAATTLVAMVQRRRST